ncbi:MAG: serine/threonine protein kinase [Spirulinaceae cyanobacterium]
MLTPDTILQNRYRLTDQLNANPSRQTWLAWDEECDRAVVVKLLALGGVVQWNDLKLFEREAEVLAQLEHPRIPKYYEFFSVDDRVLWFGLVQQHIPGISLKEKLKKERSLPPEQVQQIALEVLEILDFLHTQSPPVLHRDIKPSNLIWGEDDCVYLIDFGAVQAKPPHPGATFTIVGTYGYTPLEQYGGKAVAASDLYGLGATLIHLLTGVAPSELPQQDLKIQFRDRLPSDTDPHFANWLEVITETSLDKRYSSTKEALSTIQSQKRLPAPSFEIQPLSQPLKKTVARLHKSLDRLIIEIPSQFEVVWLQPFYQALNRGFEWGRDRVKNLIELCKNLDEEEKEQLSKSALSIGLILLVLNALGLLPMVELAFQVVLLLLSLPIALLGSVLPFGAIAWLILSQNRSDYFEKTRICFDPKLFEIERSSTQGRKREQGKIDSITDVEVITVRDRKGRFCQGIAIHHQQKTAFLPVPRRHRSIFGENLSEAELKWLVGEIRLWLNDNS